MTRNVPQLQSRLAMPLEGILVVGPVEIYFRNGKPLLIYGIDGSVYFTAPEKPADQRIVNAYATEAPHIRVAPSEFEFYLAQSLIGQLRPLLRPPTPAGDTP